MCCRRDRNELAVEIVCSRLTGGDISENQLPATQQLPEDSCSLSQVKRHYKCAQAMKVDKLCIAVVLSVSWEGIKSELRKAATLNADAEDY
jgi:hypothetical protein